MLVLNNLLEDMVKWNKQVERLIKFTHIKKMMTIHTWFELPKRLLYIWTSPTHTTENIIHNQTDYILINQRYRNSILSTKSCPEADVKSDRRINWTQQCFEKKKNIKSSERHYYEFRSNWQKQKIRNRSRHAFDMDQHKEFIIEWKSGNT